jgi:hypothetical protein
MKVREITGSRTIHSDILIRNSFYLFFNRSIPLFRNIAGYSIAEPIHLQIFIEQKIEIHLKILRCLFLKICCKTR